MCILTHNVKHFYWHYCTCSKFRGKIKEAILEKRIRKHNFLNHSILWKENYLKTLNNVFVLKNVAKIESMET